MSRENHRKSSGMRRHSVTIVPGGTESNEMEKSSSPDRFRVRGQKKEKKHEFNLQSFETLSL